jgi:hypothetical protein
MRLSKRASNAARLLGKRAAGRPKNFSQAELERRAARMRLLNAVRRATRKE